MFGFFKKGAERLLKDLEKGNFFQVFECFKELKPEEKEKFFQLLPGEEIKTVFKSFELFLKGDVAKARNYVEPLVHSKSNRTRILAKIVSAKIFESQKLYSSARKMLESAIKDVQTESERKAIEKSLSKLEEPEKKKSLFSKGLEKTRRFLSLFELKGKPVDDELFEEIEEKLILADVGVKTSTELVEKLKEIAKKRGIKTSDELMECLKEEIVETLKNCEGCLNLSSNPSVILVVGVNGTGKTTTVGKLALLLRKEGRKVLTVPADTFRAGAIEQLREHINNLNLKLIAQNYGSDPAAVAHDALLYAKSHKVDCVLIDSAGRMQTNKNLMEQIAKITKVVSPDLKIFVGDSLAGNDTVSQAREFYEHTTFDGAILTKSDADARGGAALSIVAVTKKPVICVGTGQGYDDLELFSKEAFIERVFGKSEPVAEPQPEPVAEPEIKESSSDPFEGIKTEDIEDFAELFDTPPPSSDKEAFEMAKKIRKWVADGRPK